MALGFFVEAAAAAAVAGWYTLCTRELRVENNKGGVFEGLLCCPDTSIEHAHVVQLCVDLMCMLRRLGSLMKLDQAQA